MKKYISFLLLLSGAIAMAPAAAQQSYNSPVARFYRNNYLANPAYAGSRENAFFYGLVNHSWLGFDGAPTLTQFTADLPFAEHSGAGIQVSTDKAGVLRRTTAKLSYAYKIQTGGEDEQLKLGFSLAGYRQQLDAASVSSGGVYDPFAKSFNDRGWQVDGDFGAVYQTSNFQFSAAAFNLRQTFRKEEEKPANLETFNLMTSYAFNAGEKVVLKPLASARFFYKESWILGLGTQFTYDQLFHTSVIWQHTGSFSGTLGLLLRNIGEANFTYVTSNKQNQGQQYEVGLGVGLSGKKSKKVLQL